VESLVSVAIVSANPVKVGPPTTIYTARSGGPEVDSFVIGPDGRVLLRLPVALAPDQGARLVYVQNWRAGLRK
jgi:hypothetical protein